MMDKREVLEKLLRDVIGDNEATDKWLNSIYGFPLDQALTALNKLEKEKMLGYVGGDREVTEDNVLKANYDDGYNIAKAEIRRKINLQRGLRV